MAVVKKAKRSSTRTAPQAALVSPYCLHFVQDDAPSWFLEVAQEATQAGYTMQFIALQTLLDTPDQLKQTDVLVLAQP